MITIKIKDEAWFRENCDSYTEEGIEHLIPSYWTKEQQRAAVEFLGNGSMWKLAGKELIVLREDKTTEGMMGCRYFVGFWIPNWAIEWVKEETEEFILGTGIQCPTKEEALRICDIIAWASKQGYLGRTEAKELCGKIVYNNKGWL